MPASKEIGIETEAKRATYKHEPRRWIKPTNTKKYQPPKNKNNSTAACSPIRLFYSAITIYVGFKLFDEGKTMGLSAFGTDKYLKDFDDIIYKNKDTFKINAWCIVYYQ